MTGTGTPQRLRFHAEYECYPLWLSLDGGGEDNPDPHALGLPDGLVEALVAWSDEFDALFDPDDFTRPLFDTPEHEAEFDRRGLDLATRVAVAVGGRFSVRYSSSTTGVVELS